MNTLSALWRMFTKDIRRYQEELKRQRQSEALRLENRAAINAAHAQKKKYQDECSHRRVDGSTTLVWQPESVSGEPSAICQHCQKIVLKSSEPTVYHACELAYRTWGDGGTRTSKSKKSARAIKKERAELQKLYDMPLRKLRALVREGQ